MKKHLIYDPERECMSRDELTAWQSARLRETVRREYDNVPMYRARMREKGLSPEDIRGVEDLKYLPFMEKTDLRDYYPFDLLASPRSEIVRIQGSSGTTGKPIVAGYTRNDVDVWSDMMARTLTAAGCTKDDVVQIAYGLGLFTGGFGAYQGADRIGAMVVPMSSGNTQRQIMMMRDLGVTLLCCTPSYATYLGETIREMGLEPGRDIRLKAGCFGAEPWTEAMRGHLEELLGIDACDIYGLTEIAGPGVAGDCQHRTGLHIWEDHFYPEIIDPETLEPLPDGEVGELVFTTISRTGTPMIRYRTRDLTRLHTEKCPCGRTMRVMDRISARSDDMLIIHGVNVFPGQIEAGLLRVPEVAPHYQIILSSTDTLDLFEIKVEVNAEAFSDSVRKMEELRKRVFDAVKSIIGLSAKIILVEPGSLPRSEGKIKRVIDNRRK